MRLLVVTNDYPPKPGGIQQYLGSLVAAYPHPVRVLAPADRPATGEAVVERHRRRFLWPTRSVTAWVAQRAADFGPDAILFGAPHPLPAMAGALRRRFGVPVGILSHGAEITIPAAVPGLRTVLRRLLGGADVNFAVSRFTAGRVEALTRRPVRVIGSGVDPAFAPAPELPSGSPPVVGCVSRFVPRKGQHRLIAAAARLAAGGRPVRLLFVGRGRTEARLRRRARRAGVEAEFAVGVPFSELPGLYRRMNLFCMPCRSRWFGLEAEGFGLVYLEAAASGLAVVAGDSGGAPETVVRGETGFVVHSTADLVEALETLLDDPGLARAMGERGRRRIEEEFGWERTARRLVEGFEAARA